jgi:hypothetical protein
VRSMLRYPLPFGRKEVRARFGRLKLLVVTILRMARLHT